MILYICSTYKSVLHERCDLPSKLGDPVVQSVTQPHLQRVEKVTKVVMMVINADNAKCWEIQFY